MNFQIRQIKLEFRQNINDIIIHFFTNDSLVSWCGKTSFDHFKTDILLDGSINDIMNYIEKNDHSEYQICLFCIERQLDKLNKLKNKEN